MKILLTDVLYIPELATNLLSIKTCASKGILTTFGKEYCMLKQGSTPVAKGDKIDDKLYKLEFKPSTSEPRARGTSNEPVYSQQTSCGVRKQT